MNRLDPLTLCLLTATCTLWACARDDVGRDHSADAAADASVEPGDADPGADAVVPVDGMPVKHRASAERCDNTREPGNATPGPGQACGADADCTEGENGRCTDYRGMNECTYDQCFMDATCPADRVCECGGGFWSDHNVCLGEGDCRTDADCGEGGACSPTLGSCGDYAGVVGYYCHTPEDACVDDTDCVGPGEYCAFNPAAGHWMCSDAQCVG